MLIRLYIDICIGFLYPFIPMVDCYVGMGGNFTDTLAAMREVVFQIKNNKEISLFQLSRLYRTSPVSSIPQPFYLNAVCRFQTALSLNQLCELLQELERSIGKELKSKQAPRLIDLDLLFYGSLIIETPEWTVPHPCWHERMFVLAPLADVTDILPVGKLKVREFLDRFTNPHQETVCVNDQQII